MIIKADEPNVDWSSFPVNIIGESYGMFIVILIYLIVLFYSA